MPTPAPESQPLLPTTQTPALGHGHPGGYTGGPMHAERRRVTGGERGGVLRSSLDIVFSYSRSQQLFFGSHLPSAPSFVDHPNFGFSSIDSPRRRARRSRMGAGAEDGGDTTEEEGEESRGGTDEEDDDDGEGYYRRRGGDGRDSIAEGTEGEDEEEGTSRDGSRERSTDSVPGGRSRSRVVTEQGIFGHDNSPSPSRPSSPSPLGTRTADPAPPTGFPRIKRPVLPGQGTPSYLTSSRTITSTTAFDNPVPVPLPTPRRPELNDRLSSGRFPLGSVFEDSPLPGPSSLLETPQSKFSRKTSQQSLSSSPFSTTRRRMSAAYWAGGSAFSTPYGERLAPMSSVLGLQGQGARRASGGVVSVRGKDGVEEEMVVMVGRSTNGQTLFNAIAVLVGIGVLSEPLAFAYCGWIGGTLLLVFFGIFTNYTAKLLAKIIMDDPTLRGYSDLGIKAFGWKARLYVDVLFCLELFALSIAWIVLFGDSMHAVVGGLSSNVYKVIGFFIIVPTTLLPLHLLSIPSLLSLISSLLLIIILLVDGFTKTSAPGSILHPVPTHFGPDWVNNNYLGGLGLLIAGFGGHAIIPSLAIDMKEPKKFNKMINIAYGVATIVFLVAGAAGYLMCGDTVSDEITRDLMEPKYGFNQTLNKIATWMIVVNPVTKFALCTRPLNLTVETIFSLNPSAPPPDPATVSPNGKQPDMADLSSQFTIRTTGAFPDVPVPANAPKDFKRSESIKTAWRVFARGAVTASCVAVAILLPGFGRLMAFLGSFTTFFICVILPLAFYTAIVPKEERGMLRDIIHLVLFMIGVIMMVSGTVWAIVVPERPIYP